MSPYKSRAQAALFHAKLKRGEISKSTVEHWDKASKGKKLPPRLHRKQKRGK